MVQVRALKDYDFNVTPGTIENNEQRAHRMTLKTRNGSKKGDFSIPFQLSYGDFDDFFEEALGGTWAPVATSAVALTVGAVGKTFTRAAGSFVDVGFAVGQQITTSGFTTPANNGTFVISTVTALVITCSTATGLADETCATAVTVTTVATRLRVGNLIRSSTFEDRNPDANLFEQYNGCAISGFDLDISPEKVVSGTFKGIARDCVLAGVANAAIAVASGGKTFTCAAGGFLATGAPFRVGDPIITTGFTNAGNNGIFMISAVTDTVITCSTASGLVTEAAGTSTRNVFLGSLGTPTEAGTDDAYESYTGDLSEGSVDQAEVTGVKISFDIGLEPKFVILTSGADAAASIRPKNEDIKCTGDVMLFFENQEFKKKFLAGTESSLNVLLGTGLPGGKSMRFIMNATQYTGVKRDKGSTIVETGSYKANYHPGTATCLEIQKIP
jgi:hypothetical protein